ncbi:MAG: HD domain-containing protein [Nanoarchaeota archaeon]
MKNYVIITDPLYKQILIPKEFEKFLDLPEMQRLKHIKQTSFVDQLYPNATHTRFSHSIGVYYLMSKILQRIKTTEKDKKNLLIAALLHDIGHGPFSHMWEKVFPHFNHEDATREILEKLKLPEVQKILDKEHKFSPLISSMIDVDKLDYMARDSYFCGVSYGLTEVDYIMQSFNVKDKKIVINKKSIPSIENLINQRITLYKNVYYHKFSKGYEFLFEKIFERAKDMFKEGKEFYLEENMKSFFEKTNTLKNLIAVDDVAVLYHIRKWAENEDKNLSDLAKRFLERKSFKILNLNYQKVNIDRIRKKVEEKYDSKYYFGHVKSKIKVIENDIVVDFHGKEKKIENLSDTFKFFKQQNHEIEYLIFPKDV